jgi:hypothetical protein
VVRRAAFDTEIDQRSAMIDRHLINWRSKACEWIPTSAKDDLFHTSLLALSGEVARDFKAPLKKLIQEGQRAPTLDDPEKLFCLSIDWFGWP